MIPFSRRLATRISPSLSVPTRRSPARNVGGSRLRCLEPLEDRRVLSTFVWSNRGDDDFGDVFGGQAEAARMVVDAAMDIWERIIVDFNYNSTPSAGSNTFELEFFADGDDTGCGASTDTGGDIDGVPTDADITILSCSGQTWFLDPTPFDSAEFLGRVANDFYAFPQMGSPAANTVDLLTVVVHEIGHAVGISQDEDFLLEDWNDNTPPFVDTGIGDALNPGVGTLWTYNFGPNLAEVLFTDNNGGPSGDDTDEPLHVAGIHPSNTATEGSVTYFGVADLMNPSGGAARAMPSLANVRILQEVYSYTVTPPQTFGTFHAHLDQTTGNLLIRGNGQGLVDGSGNPLNFVNTTASNDKFHLRRNGNNLEVTVDLGIRVPGTATNLQDMISVFPMNAINSITILPNDGTSTTDGNDHIILDMRLGPINPAGGITIDGGSGTNDLTVYGGSVTTSYELDTNSITVNGTTATFDNIHEVTLDAGSLSDNTFRVLNTSALWTDLTINGSSGDDIIIFERHNAATMTKVDLIDGDDQVYFSFLGASLDRIDGSIQIFGHEFGSETIQLFDMNDNFGQTHTFEEINIFAGRYISSHGPTITWSSVDEFKLFAGNGDDNVFFTGTPATRIAVNGGHGNDTFLVDSNGNASGGTVATIQGPIEVDGGATGFDTLTLNDVSRNTGASVTITDTSIGADAGDQFFDPLFGALFYDRLDQITLNMGHAGNTIVVQRTRPFTEYYINAGFSTDDIIISSTGVNDLGEADGIVSPIFVDGQDSDDRITIADNLTNVAKQTTINSMRVNDDPTDTLFGPGGVLEYVGIRHITLYAGWHGNTIYVTDIDLDALDLFLGEGDDVVAFDANRDLPGGSAQGIYGHVRVYGQAGTDVMRVDNSDVPTPLVGTVNATTIGSTAGDNVLGPGSSLTYDQFERLELASGQGNDTWRVLSTSTDTQVVAFLMNAGDDSLFVDSNGATSGGQLSSIHSTIDVNGGGDFLDVVELQDSSDVTGDVVTITPTTLGAAASDSLFGAGGSLQYAALTLLRLRGSTGGDQATILGTAPGIFYELSMNGGDDRLRVLGEVSSPVVFHGAASTPAPGDVLELVGDGMTMAEYRPDASTTGDGQVVYAQGTLDFASVETISARQFSEFVTTTPNASDLLEIDTPSAGVQQLSGMSGALTLRNLAFADIDRFVVDMGSVETGAPSGESDRLDYLDGDLAASGVNELVVHAGHGVNRVDVLGGRANLSTTTAGTGNIQLNVLGANAVVNLVSSQSFSRIIIGTGAVVTIPSGDPKVIQTARLVISGEMTPTGTFDIGDNGLIVNYVDAAVSPLPTIQAQIDHARTANAPLLWTAPGITSALAAANPSVIDVLADEATDLFGSSGGMFLGTPVAPGDRAVLIRTAAPGQDDGDFNDDGLYNLLDIDALVAEIASGSHPSAFDLTGDGLVDLADRDAWLDQAGAVNLGTGLAYPLGDANLDAVVDGSDFNAWNAHKFTSIAQWSSGDFNADGVVDGSDYGIWNSHKFTSAQLVGRQSSASPLPARRSIFEAIWAEMA